MKESRENHVELKGFQTTAGIKAILDFIYTGNYIKYNLKSCKTWTGR